MRRIFSMTGIPIMTDMGPKSKSDASWLSSGELGKLIIPSIITGIVAIIIANIKSNNDISQLKIKSDFDIKKASEESKNRDQYIETKIQAIIDKSNEFKKLFNVKGRFDAPHRNQVLFTRREMETGLDVADIDCKGEIYDLPKGFHLWIAVEIDGFVYFKEPEVKVTPGVNGARGTWTTAFREPTPPDRSKEFSLRLYVANDEANYQIKNWLDTGREKNVYEKISFISNTVIVEHVDNIHIKTKQ